jgi:UDP-glucose/GDP-mannose dehydrogenase family, NAD binding domain
LPAVLRGPGVCTDACLGDRLWLSRRRACRVDGGRRPQGGRGGYQPAQGGGARPCRGALLRTRAPRAARGGPRDGPIVLCTDVAAIADADVHFVCVATPQRSDSYAADVRFVDNAFAQVARVARAGSLVVGKSTVPVGTAARLASELAATGLQVAWNPEFSARGLPCGTRSNRTGWSTG